MTPVGEETSILHVETIVHHSLGSDYFATVYIPINYKVLNQTPYTGTDVPTGYQAYQMKMKRRYRDVLAKTDFIITPQSSEQESPPSPVLVHFENLKQLLHKDATYLLSIKDKQVQLEGPELIEAKYPQKFGM